MSENWVREWKYLGLWFHFGPSEKCSYFSITWSFLVQIVFMTNQMDVLIFQVQNVHKAQRWRLVGGADNTMDWCVGTIQPWTPRSWSYDLFEKLRLKTKWEFVRQRLSFCGTELWRRLVKTVPVDVERAKYLRRVTWRRKNRNTQNCCHQILKWVIHGVVFIIFYCYSCKKKKSQAERWQLHYQNHAVLETCQYVYELWIHLNMLQLSFASDSFKNYLLFHENEISHTVTVKKTTFFKSRFMYRDLKTIWLLPGFRICQIKPQCTKTADYQVIPQDSLEPASAVQTL